MPPSAIDTLCGYAIVDVRKSLVEAIDRRDRRAAHRWAAELVATPAAVGSLWAAFVFGLAGVCDVSPARRTPARTAGPGGGALRLALDHRFDECGRNLADD